MFSQVWNGRVWTTNTPPSPTGATTTNLFGDSCVSERACEAVGDYKEASGTLVTLAESWNGSAWSVQTTPNPEGATQSLLRGVSCTSAIECIAAGHRYSGSFRALIERYS